MLLREGTHELVADQTEGRPVELVFASASGPVDSHVKVWLGTEQVEEVHLGGGVPHTWWSSNPLFDVAQLAKDTVITIEVGPEAVLRVDSNIQPRAV